MRLQYLYFLLPLLLISCHCSVMAQDDSIFRVDHSVYQIESIEDSLRFQNQYNENEYYFNQVYSYHFRDRDKIIFENDGVYYYRFDNHDVIGKDWKRGNYQEDNPRAIIRFLDWAYSGRKEIIDELPCDEIIVSVAVPGDTIYSNWWVTQKYQSNITFEERTSQPGFVIDQEYFYSSDAGLQSFRLKSKVTSVTSPDFCVEFENFLKQNFLYGGIFENELDSSELIMPEIVEAVNDHILSKDKINFEHYKQVLLKMKSLPNLNGSVKNYKRYFFDELQEEYNIEDNRITILNRYRKRTTDSLVIDVSGDEPQLVYSLNDWEFKNGGLCRTRNEKQTCTFFDSDRRIQSRVNDAGTLKSYYNLAGALESTINVENNKTSKREYIYSDGNLISVYRDSELFQEIKYYDNGLVKTIATNNSLDVYQYELFVYRNKAFNLKIKQTSRDDGDNYLKIAKFDKYMNLMSTEYIFDDGKKRFFNYDIIYE